ncbi:MAG: hypothetical protein ABR538_03310 [Candidatus Binatia bacterium]
MATNMKTRAGTIALAAALALSAFNAAPAGAYFDDYPPDGEHPLRIVHYFVAPIGHILEWTVTRPLWAVGRVVAPHEHIGDTRFRACSRERPGRSCTNVVK